MAPVSSSGFPTNQPTRGDSTRSRLLVGREREEDMGEIGKGGDLEDRAN